MKPVDPVLLTGALVCFVIEKIRDCGHNCDYFVHMAQASLRLTRCSLKNLRKRIRSPGGWWLGVFPPNHQTNQLHSPLYSSCVRATMSSSPVQRKKPTNTDNAPTSVRSQSTKAKSKKAGIGLLSILGGLMFSVIIFFAASFLITESWTWGYKSKYTNFRTYIPPRQIVLSEEQLKQYDGTDPSLPIYIAINGEIYDVTAGKNYYGPGGGYHFFAGVDGARAYITGCFQTHLTNDLRGLTEEQLKSLDNWQDFYRDHHTYFKAGTVMHAPIDDDAPLPVPCDGEQMPSD